MKKRSILALLTASCLMLASCGQTAQETPDPTQENTGSAYTAGTYEATVNGHNAPITVAITVSDNAITKVEVPTENETIGVGKVAIERMTQRIVDEQSLACDVITGASITSRAILNGAATALKEAGMDTTELTKAPAKPEAKDAEYTADVVVVGGGEIGRASCRERV